MSQQPLIPTAQSTHLLPPHVDLEHVFQYNNHGRALVALIRGREIHQRHHPLILGLFAVYSLLISLGYFNSANISWPPHSDFRRQDWLDIGFAPEVVDILELLPYLKDDINRGEPVDIAVNAPTLSYLGQGNGEYRGIVEIPGFLNRNDFLVTGNGRCMFGPRNFYYLYKSNDATMTILQGWGDHFPNYRSLESHPAQLIMDNWVQNLHNLIYLPKSAKLREQPVLEFDYRTGNRKQPSEADLIAFANPKNWRAEIPLREDYKRNELNEFRAIRNLYQKYGWPSRFDREGFLSAVDDFQKRVEDYDKRLQRSNPKAFWPIPGVAFTPEELAMRKEKDDFLQETAGPLAIRRLEEHE